LRDYKIIVYVWLLSCKIPESSAKFDSFFHQSVIPADLRKYREIHGPRSILTSPTASGATHCQCHPPCQWGPGRMLSCSRFHWICVFVVQTRNRWNRSFACKLLWGIWLD